MMQKIFLIAAALCLTACASATPEQILMRGYQSSSATVKSTTTLVQRDQISTRDAQNVLMLGKTAKATLDQGKADLAKCRATVGAKCDAVPNINLGAGVLQNLDDYLKTHEGSK